MNSLDRQWEEVRNDVIDAVDEIGRSGWFVLGKQVMSFEKEICSLFGKSRAVGVASGLDAIEIGLRALGCTFGSKVLTTPLSAFATTLAILKVGAIPIFVDVDPLGLIDLDAAERLLAKDTSIKFVVPVHLYGFPLDLERISSWRTKFGVSIIEDCAQAINAAYKGIQCGAVGQIAATSFYPTKNLGAMGDAGALMTNDETLAKRSEVLRDYGQSAKYFHSEVGLNSRLDELHAAILNKLISKLPKWTERRKQIAARYLDEIENPMITTLRPSEPMDPVWHLFPVLVDADRRNSFRAHMISQNIETGVHYPSIIPKQAALKALEFHIHGSLAGAEAFAASQISLPINPYLTEEEITFVISACNRWRL